MLVYLAPQEGESRRMHAEACPRMGETVVFPGGKVMRVKLVVWSAVREDERLVPTVSLEAL